MTNHTHLIVVPETDAAISDAMRDTHGAYATMFNRKYGFTEHLWQARFYSCVLDDEHLRHAVRYVERSPVRAGMVVRAFERKTIPDPAQRRMFWVKRTAISTPDFR